MGQQFHSHHAKYVSKIMCLMAYLWIFVLFSSFSFIFMHSSSFYASRNHFWRFVFYKIKGLAYSVQCTAYSVLKCTFIQWQWVSLIMTLMAWKTNYGWLNIEHWTLSIFLLNLFSFIQRNFFGARFAFTIRIPLSASETIKNRHYVWHSCFVQARWKCRKMQEIRVKRRHKSKMCVSFLPFALSNPFSVKL